MLNRLRVEPYSIDRLRDVIVNCFNQPQTKAQYVDEKLHIRYFESYFRNPSIQAKTIVIEEPYTDRDYLEDYSAYYVRCLDKYRSRCARLHFYSIEFSQEDFDSLIKGNPNSLSERDFCAEENYIGFVVIRPLPHTFIGRTCLRTYAETDIRRYPVIKDYPVHLAGFTLKVRSLAFQEQDKAASACATSALWTAFHGTAAVFHHALYSPIEITRLASARVPGLGRALPNSGLTITQMAGAVQSVGLEPEIMEVNGENGEFLLQGICRAYLQMGIPILLCVSLHDVSNQLAPTPLISNPSLNGHAVTVTGFSYGRPHPVPLPQYGTLLRASCIDQLYIHDDQVGPFSKCTFAGPLQTIDPKTGRSVPYAHSSLTTSWGDKRGTGHIRFVPSVIIVPLYHKIRIPYQVVLSCLIEVDGRHEYLRGQNPALLSSRLQWDLFLTTGWRVHEEIRKCSELPTDDRWALIQKPLPKFVWVARATCDGRSVVDVLYDATDIETCEFFLNYIWYDFNVMTAYEAMPSGPGILT